MKKIVIYCLLGLLITALSAGPAAAYSHANAYGGSTSHSYGSTSHTNAYGGSTSHAYGEGTSHTNTYGGSTSHGWECTAAPLPALTALGRRTPTPPVQRPTTPLHMGPTR